MKITAIILSACFLTGIFSGAAVSIESSNASLLTEDTVSLPIINDTIYRGNLFWNMNCKLDTTASKQKLDSLVTILAGIQFDSCRIFTIEYISEKNSQSCAYNKSQQLCSILANRCGRPQGLFIAQGKYFREQPVKHLTSTSIIVYGVK